MSVTEGSCIAKNWVMNDKDMEQLLHKKCLNRVGFFSMEKKEMKKCR